ncbi:putative E3 ubiquitin-protein ligase XERICO [Panicum miliaceum]|uniref:E3 ubiquitin-protein ligase XERICO n=1 Tax=Panicum miliaceum TaxID=4540 RepID=A0A3L6TFV9_PANMI|nr:putative E3 ubiquitin-protein ligase XERICO [Panicum miliaceum]
MGISSMPEPRDSLLGFLVYNAVISLAALAGLVRAALVFLDLGDWEADGAGSEDRLVSAAGQGSVERMHKPLRPARLGPIPGVTTTCGAAAAAAGDDCSVCLAGFVAEAVVNRLPCGHLFHRGCLETWLRYERATCPLCRAHVPVPAAPADDTPGLRYPECE